MSNSVLANKYCISRIFDEKIELQLVPLPIETCITSSDKNNFERNLDNENYLDQFKTTEEKCNEKGLITLSKLKKELENKAPSVICTINDGTLKDCKTPWGGEVFYESNPAYFNFRVFGFIDKDKNIIGLNSSAYHKGIFLTHLEKPPKRLSNIYYNQIIPGTWMGKCSVFKENITPNKLLYLGLENIQKKIHYTLNGNKRSMGTAVKRYYKFESPLVINDDQGNF
tara:strand:- start:12 stop:689 length:678 start_codon:yes stop_codon:yes gene_type:complete